MKDQLFVLRPGFTDKGALHFCPYSAQVIGFLTYYPQVRDSLEVVELDLPKPRHPLVDLVQTLPGAIVSDRLPPDLLPDVGRAVGDMVKNA